MNNLVSDAETIFARLLIFLRKFPFALNSHAVAVRNSVRRRQGTFLFWTRVFFLFFFLESNFFNQICLEFPYGYPGGLHLSVGYKKEVIL